MTSFRLVSAVSLIAAGGFMACGEKTVEPPPSQSTNALAAVSGNGQMAQAGQALADPLVVKVTKDGSPVSGVTITWAVTGGGGSLNPTSSTTDAAGEASSAWTLGGSAGANTATATASGATGSPVTFTATGTAIAPQTAAVDVGDNFFQPATATIAAGGTVTWTWTGNISHNVTFSTGTNSATQSAGTFSRTFPTAGSYDYLCTIHGTAMSGTIVVQ